jgi:hypothetical protein
VCNLPGYPIGEQVEQHPGGCPGAATGERGGDRERERGPGQRHLADVRRAGEVRRDDRDPEPLRD